MLADEEGAWQQASPVEPNKNDTDLTIDRNNDYVVDNNDPSLDPESLAEAHPGEGADVGIIEALEKGADLSTEDADYVEGRAHAATSSVVSQNEESEKIPQIWGEEGESAEPTGFPDLSSTVAMSHSQQDLAEEAQPDKTLHRMYKFALYETTPRFYLIGSDVLDKKFRVLKIDRTAPPGQLSVMEDETVYSKDQMNELLSRIEDGNRAAGGMRYRGTSWGLLGFIRFTEAYYMLLIKKKVQVATLGGHYVFQIDDTDLIPLSTGSTASFRSNRNADETKFLSILGNLDLNRHFYFSYSYNITRTLQHNVMKRREAFAENVAASPNSDFNDMFMWNHHLLKPALETLKNPFDWCMPIIHGFVDQAGRMQHPASTKVAHKLL